MDENNLTSDRVCDREFIRYQEPRMKVVFEVKILRFEIVLVIN